MKVGNVKPIREVFAGILVYCALHIPAHAKLLGNGGLAPCADGGVNVQKQGSACVTTGTGDSTGLFVFGEGQHFGPIAEATSISFIGLYRLYPPYTGVYRAGLALCAGSDGCSLRAAALTLVGLNAFKLRSNDTIYSQNVQVGGYAPATLSSPHSGCTFLQDSSGRRWSSNDSTSCADGLTLPDTPAVCYLNANADLNVALGTLERGSIASLPAAGAPGNVKKDVPVLCTRDADTTVSTTFQYTPLTFNGHEVISAKSKGLGVAVFYKGKLVGPSSAPITETFALGYTSREFEFQAVRDPNIALKDIPTGNFSASATMVMTQQ